jgi:hypothetical protein
VTGVTNLSEGSIVYGDASEIVTELNSGSAGDVLQMGVSVPQWASVGGSWNLEGSDTQTNVANLNVNVSDRDVYQIMYNVGNSTVSGFDLAMTINNIGGTGYDTGRWYVNNSAAGSGGVSIGQAEAILSVGGIKLIQGMCLVLHSEIQS